METKILLIITLVSLTLCVLSMGVAHVCLKGKGDGENLRSPSYPAPENPTYTRPDRPGTSSAEAFLNSKPPFPNEKFTPNMIKDEKAELMEYEVIDGSIVVPWKDKAYEDYRNRARKKVLQEISNANDAGFTELRYEPIPLWLKDELSKKGYYLEITNYHSGNDGSIVVGYTIIKWGETNDK